MDATQILKLRHSPIHNYVIPGLTSWLIGGKSDAGTVRLFEMTRNQHEPITPHSHRFPLYSYVVQGAVTNILWRKHMNGEQGCDQYRESTLAYAGACGKYSMSTGAVAPWEHRVDEYFRGDSYSMDAEQVHSIKFDKGTLLIVFEGKTESAQSSILEPVCYGEVVPTFKVEDWMFKRPPVPARKP